jgi:hypothetical protein
LGNLPFQIPFLPKNIPKQAVSSNLFPIYTYSPKSMRDHLEYKNLLQATVNMNKTKHAVLKRSLLLASSKSRMSPETFLEQKEACLEELSELYKHYAILLQKLKTFHSSKTFKLTIS